jgi:hypothetical protein
LEIVSVSSVAASIANKYVESAAGEHVASRSANKDIVPSAASQDSAALSLFGLLDGDRQIAQGWRLEVDVIVRCVCFPSVFHL